MWQFHKFTQDEPAAASELFKQATEIEPDAAPGHIWLARTEGGRCSFGWATDRNESLRVAHRAANRAVQIDPHNPYSHYAVAAACNAAFDFESASRAAHRAVSLNSSFAFGHLILGVATFHCGRSDEAVSHLEHGLRLSPYDPQHFTWLFNLAWAYCFLGQPEKGLKVARRAVALPPEWESGLKTVAGNALKAGNIKEATTALLEADSASDRGANLMSLLKMSQPVCRI
jgi:adenylate cyclase